MKREKVIRLLILIASISTFIYMAMDLDFGRSHKYDDLLVDFDTYSQITAERTLSEDSAVPQLFFDEFQIQYDSLNNNYLYSYVENSPSRFNPLIRTVSDFFLRYDIAILGDVLNTESIQSNEQARILLYNDDEYKEFTFSATSLPVLSISMDEDTGDEHNPIGAVDTTAQFTLFDNRADVVSSDRLIQSQSYIRLRGASSLEYPKNQFRINLREFSINGTESNNHLPLLGMREDDDWMLYSPFNDPEKIRNTFSYNIWHDTMGTNNPFDINTGTEGKFVEVFVDGSYWGIYSLLFPIDAKQLDLNRTSSETSDFYYRTFSHDAFNLADFTEYHESPIRGRFELRDPDNTGDPEQWIPLVDHLQSLEYEEYDLNRYLDEKTYLPNLIDYYLFYALVQAYDNNTKNRNYIAKYDDSSHYMLESPWDLDLTWGMNWTGELPTLSAVNGDPYANPVPHSSHVTRAIELGMTDVISDVRERYAELRETSWSEESLFGQLDLLELQLYDSGAALRDQHRWPTAAYAENLDNFRNYMSIRLESMDRHIDELSGGGY